MATTMVENRQTGNNGDTLAFELATTVELVTAKILPIAMIQESHNIKRGKVQNMQQTN
jgi:hypothetical protein